MIDCIVTWATILSPIVGTIAIIVSICISRKSSQDTQRQINEIRNLLDVLVAIHNLNAFEAQKQYEKELEAVNREIEELMDDIDTIVSPFLGGALIDRIHEQENRSALKRELQELMAKRKEIEYSLSLIDNYIKKTKK